MAAGIRLLETGGRRLLESGGFRLLESRPIGPRHFWRIVILDASGNLVDIPQSDIESWQLTSQLNGGSGPATIQFVRDFNKAGALGYGYQVLIWFWPESASMPIDPYYSGTIIDELDQEQLEARGRITIALKGDMTLLDAAVVDSTVSGGIGGGVVMPDAVSYLSTMITGYQPPGFLAPALPSSMFTLEPVQFSGTGLGQAIDTIVKMSTDSGLLWTWFVKTNAHGKRQVVVRIDQNPNSVVGAAPFSMQFPGITCDQYTVSTKYRDIINVATVYGGKDPLTGLQVFVSVENGTSVAQYGPWEAVLNIPWLLDNGAATSYAQAYLTQKGSPDAQGTMRLLQPDPSIIPGRWAQLNEAPASSLEPASVKQVRVSQVTVSCTKDRIEQVLYTASPVPFLDNAIYRLGLNILAQTATQIAPLSQNLQQVYVRAGGAVAAASSSPAKITISACEAVFPGTGIIDIAALGATVVQDSVSMSGGDGDYQVFVTSSGTFVIVKGSQSGSTTQQLLAYVAVINGAAFVTDGRTFIAMPSIDQTQSLSLSGSATLGTPTNVGTGAYDQPITFTLNGPFGTLANSSLSKLQLGWRQNGVSSIQIAPAGTEISPNASGSYAGTVPGIGAGATVDIYVRGMDTNDRPTNWLFLATTSPQAFSLSASGNVTGNLPYGNHATAVQDVISSGGGVNVSPTGGVTGNLPYGNHATAVQDVISSGGGGNVSPTGGVTGNLPFGNTTPTEFPTATIDPTTGYIVISDQSVYPTGLQYQLTAAGVGTMLSAAWNAQRGASGVSFAIWLFYTAASGGNGYFATWYEADGKIYITKVTAGSATVLATSSVSYTLDTTKMHNLEFIATETTAGTVNLTAIIDGQIAIQASDSSSPYTSGYVAAQFRDASATNYIDQKTITIELGGDPSSTGFKAQANVVPNNIPPSDVFIFSPTSALDPSQIQFESSPATIYFPDGSQYAWPGLTSVTVSSSGANGTWYASFSIIPATGSYLWFASQTPPTLAQIAPFTADGVIPVFINQSFSVTAGSFGFYSVGAGFRHL